MIRPDDLIPPDSDLAHLLAQWSEDTDTRTWNIANVTNELIEELEGGVATRMDVYRAVAARCKGKKVDTIRRWAEVAADFPKNVQKKYASLLSFEHFKAARRLYKDGFTPSLEYALAWCVEGNDDKTSAGRFHTVSEMLAQFLPPDVYGSPLERAWGRSREKLYDAFLLVDNDTRRNRLLELWGEIDHIVTESKTLDGGGGFVVQSNKQEMEV